MKQCVLSFADFNNRFERNTFHGHKRRAIQLGLPATLTMQQWYQNVLHFGWKCAYCQERYYEVLEHFISLSAGGGTTSDNCVPACQSCNVIKTQRGLHPEIASRVQAYLMTCRSEVAG